MVPGNLILTALVAAVLPLKPPLSAEARRHPGPTVIRAGELGKSSNRRIVEWSKQLKDEAINRKSQIEALKKSARDLADRMEKMTVDDLSKSSFAELERAMKRAGKPQAEIDRLRNQLQQTVEKIRAEGRELKRRYDKQR